MGRIVDFFGAPQAPTVPLPNNQVLVEQLPSRLIEGNQTQNGREIVMVQRDQNVDQVLRIVQQNNFGGKII